MKVELILDCLRSLVKYVGGYHGLLSGVTVRPGSVEPHSVVECLYACREGLDFGDLETLGSGMKVTATKTVGCLLRRETSKMNTCFQFMHKTTALLSQSQHFTSNKTQNSHACIVDLHLFTDFLVVIIRTLQFCPGGEVKI